MPRVTITPGERDQFRALVLETAGGDLSRTVELLIDGVFATLPELRTALSAAVTRLRARCVALDAAVDAQAAASHTQLASKIADLDALAAKVQ